MSEPKATSFPAGTYVVTLLEFARDEYLLPFIKKNGAVSIVSSTEPVNEILSMTLRFAKAVTVPEDLMAGAKWKAAESGAPVAAKTTAPPYVLYGVLGGLGVLAVGILAVRALGR